MATNPPLHEYQTIYASTRTTLFTTTITASPSQKSATINFPFPPTTALLSFTTVTLSSPDTYTTLLPPQTEVVLPILVLTDVVGVVVSSGVPVLTRTLMQSPPAVQSGFGVGYGVGGGGGGEDKGCLSWGCWTRGQRVGTAVAVGVVGFMVMMVLWWGLCCRGKKERKRSRKESKSMRRSRQEIERVDEEEGGTYRVRAGPKGYGRREEISEEEDRDEEEEEVESTGTSLGGITGISMHGSSTPPPTSAAPTIHIIPPTPARGSQLRPSEELESPTRIATARSTIKKREPSPSPLPLSLIPKLTLGLGENMKDALSSTLAVVGTGFRSPTPEMEENEDEAGTSKAGMLAKEEIKKVAPIFEEKAKKQLTSNRDEEEAEISKSAKLARKTVKSAAPIIVDKAKKRLRTGREEDEAGPSKVSIQGKEAAKKLAPIVEEKTKQKKILVHLEKPCAALLVPEGNQRRLDEKSQHKRRREEEFELQARHRRDDHAEPQAKGSKWSRILPLALGILNELWQPEGGWEKVLPRPGEKSSEPSTNTQNYNDIRDHRDRHHNVPSMPTPLRTRPASPSQASESQSRYTAPAHHRPSRKHTETPDSYIPYAPHPIKYTRSEAYQSNQYEPATYTYTGEVITEPALGVFNEEDGRREIGGGGVDGKGLTATTKAEVGASKGGGVSKLSETQSLSSEETRSEASRAWWGGGGGQRQRSRKRRSMRSETTSGDSRR